MRERELVNEIVTELYKRLGQTSYRYRKAFVVGDMDCALLQRLNGAYEIITEGEETPSCDVYIITDLTISMLAHLALAAPKDKREEIILRALLSGKNVYVLQNGIEVYAYKDTAHKNMYQIYQDYLSRIQLYGIQLIDDVSVIEALPFHDKKIEKDDKKSCSVPMECSKSFDTLDLRGKKVLLEKDLKNYHLQRNCVILLDKKCIITPLAEDYIRMHMISIQKE